MKRTINVVLRRYLNERGRVNEMTRLWVISWRAWSEEAIHVKMKEPASGQEKLGSITRVKSATGKLPNRKDR